MSIADIIDVPLALADDTITLPEFPITYFPAPGADTPAAWSLSQVPQEVRDYRWHDFCLDLIERSRQPCQDKLHLGLFCATAIAERRARKNSTVSGVIVLDIDVGTDMDAVIARLRQRRIECLIYTTASSTMAARRYRIIVPVNELVNCRDNRPGYDQTDYHIVWDCVVSELHDLVVPGLDQSKHNGDDFFFLPADGPDFVIEHVDGDIHGPLAWVTIGRDNGVEFRTAKPGTEPVVALRPSDDLRQYVTDAMRANFEPTNPKRYGFLASLAKLAVAYGEQPTSDGLIDALDNEYPGYLDAKPGRRKRAEVQARNAVQEALRTVTPWPEFGLSDEEIAARAEWSPPAATRRDLTPDEVEMLALFERKATPSRCAASADAAWPVMAEAAYYGLAGEIVRTLEPQAEADPVALLIQVLVAFGNLAGRARRYYVAGAYHAPNLFALTVGPSGKGRKGTAWNLVKELFRDNEATEDWFGPCVKPSGLSTGEGMIEQVRDPVIKTINRDGETFVETIDEGVLDKRALFVETEFARTLRVMARPENILSSVMRCAWDGDDLATHTRKSNALRATDPHISVIGHTTIEDLRQHLQSTDAANGFGNRFLYMCVRRQKLLPLGPSESKLRAGLAPVIERFNSVVSEHDRTGERTVSWADVPTIARWEEFYRREAEERDGLLGAVTGRGEAQVVRLALIYALLDGDNAIRLPHLDAAIAVWDYCLGSARYIFGGMLGDPTADAILEALRQQPAGMTTTAIRDLFGRHKSATERDRALAALARRGLIERASVGTTGRPTTIWRIASVSRPSAAAA
jgi:Protein of unknown function (DUF3987)